jgi:hypothetical protein
MAMTLTDEQIGQVRMELAGVAPQLGRCAPVEREKLIREALERAGAVLTWEEWDLLGPALLDDVAAHAADGAVARGLH